MTLSKTRVLFHVTHLKRGGGIESSLMSWLNILDRNLYSVGLSIAYPTDDIKEVFRDKIPKDVEIHILGAESWLSHCRNLKKAGKLGWLGLVYEELLLPQIRKRVFRNRIESIAANYDVIIDYDLSLARFAFQFDTPLIGVSHFSFSQRLSTNKRKYRTAASYYQRYDALITICDAMRDEGKDLFPKLIDRFFTLYPGFDLSEINQRANGVVDSIPKEPYIVSVTRLEETQKDVATLIKAFALLVHKHKVSESLLIVGEGRHRHELEKLAEQLKVDHRVTFFGFSANPLPYIKGAQLMALSSKHEGLPTVLIEGLIIGQVLVSSDCPTGPKEILKNGEAGLLVPVGDAPALADAILHGLQDMNLRNSLRLKALDHANVFGITEFHKRFHQLLKAVQQEKQPQPS
jgi:glycosyltransferase involved in cell wall biosynthesis